MTQERYDVLSLFSGAGGFDVGFHQTGRFRTVLASELKKAPAITLARNFGLQLLDTPYAPSRIDKGIMVMGDVAHLSLEKLNGLRPPMLIGGPPCQDFSVVKGGNQKGIRVKRGKLYANFIRVLAGLEPAIFVFENVPGLIAANKGSAYKAIIDDFRNVNIRWKEIREIADLENNSKSTKGLGYELLFSDVIDASRMGVPQTRRRLIIVGVRSDIAQKLGEFKLASEIQRVRGVLHGGKSSFAQFPMTVMEVLTGKPIPDLATEYKAAMSEYDQLWLEKGLPKALHWKRNVWEALSMDPVEDYLRINNVRDATTGQISAAFEDHCNILNELGYLNRPVDGISPSDRCNDIPRVSHRVRERMKRIPPDENHEFVKGTEWNVEGRGISLIYRRTHPLKPSPTVLAFGGGGTYGYHYNRNRNMLTNRERARLQTFPDNYCFEGSAPEVRAQIGEAVPPLLASVIARSLADILDQIA